MTRKELEAQVNSILVPVASPDWLVERVCDFVELYARQQNGAKPHVMRPLLDEIQNVSRAAQQKFVKHAQRPLSEGAIEAKAVLSVTEHLLGFILSNDAYGRVLPQ